MVWIYSYATSVFLDHTIPALLLQLLQYVKPLCSRENEKLIGLCNYHVCSTIMDTTTPNMVLLFTLVCCRDCFVLSISSPISSYSVIICSSSEAAEILMTVLLQLLLYYKLKFKASKTCHWIINDVAKHWSTFNGKIFYLQTLYQPYYN